MIYRWNGFRFPPEDKKLDRGIIILTVLLLFLWSSSCSYNPYPYQTKIAYENEENTTDKTSSDKDTIKSGETWKIEQIFKWGKK